MSSETEEWEFFLGRKVSPLEIPALKVQLAAKLREEGWIPDIQDRRGDPWKRGAPYKLVQAPYKPRERHPGE